MWIDLVMVMRKGLLLGVLVFMLGFVSASCVIPTDGMIITEDTTFCEGEYELPNGILIGADNVILDCNQSIIDNKRKAGESAWIAGISINQKSNVTIKNCMVYNFTKGIVIEGGFNNTIKNNFLQTNLWAVILQGSLGNIIENNTFYEFGIGIGMWSRNKNNIIIRNKLVNKYHPGWGGGECIFSGNGGLYNSIINNSLNNCGGNGIFIGGSSYETLNGNKISGNDGCGISISYSTKSEIMNNEIYSNNKGLCFHRADARANVYFNNIYNNTYNLYNEVTQMITTENNWFGTTNQSEIESKIYDYDDNPLLSKIDYLPFLCEPYPTNIISDENGECVFDEDNDGILDDEDKCPNTEEEQIVYGCSCGQILELKPGKNKGEIKHGCSKGTIKVFTKGIGWAKDLF